jgi:hypothetical protein
MKAELPQFPRDRFMDPNQREAMTSARLIREIDVTPELIIATALFQVMGEREQLKVRALVAIAGIRQPRNGSLAGEWLDYIGNSLSYGRRNDIAHALAKLDAGEAS